MSKKTKEEKKEERRKSSLFPRLKILFGKPKNIKTKAYQRDEKYVKYEELEQSRVNIKFILIISSLLCILSLIAVLFGELLFNNMNYTEHLIFAIAFIVAGVGAGVSGVFYFLITKTKKAKKIKQDYDEYMSSLKNEDKLY